MGAINHTSALRYWARLADCVRQAETLRVALSRADRPGIDTNVHRQLVEVQLVILETELSTLANQLTAVQLRADLAARVRQTSRPFPGATPYVPFGPSIEEDV